MFFSRFSLCHLQIPGFSISNHRIELGQYLPHTSDQSDLCWFSFLSQSLKHTSDIRIVYLARKNNHIKSISKVFPSFLNEAFSLIRTTIPIHWCQTCKRSDLFSVQRTQFWTFSQEIAALPFPTAGQVSRS